MPENTVEDSNTRCATSRRRMIVLSKNSCVTSWPNINLGSGPK